MRRRRGRRKGLINPLPSQRHLCSSDLCVVPPWSHTAFKVPALSHIAVRTSCGSYQIVLSQYQSLDVLVHMLCTSYLVRIMDCTHHILCTSVVAVTTSYPHCELCSPQLTTSCTHLRSSTTMLTTSCTHLQQCSPHLGPISVSPGGALGFATAQQGMATLFTSTILHLCVLSHL